MNDNRCIAVFAIALFIASMSAQAVPSFARQTGLECVTCHLSWPELTSVGRQFKLGGYTLIKKAEGERPWLNLASEFLADPGTDKTPAPRLPLAVMVQASLTNTQSTANADPDSFPRNNDFVLQQLSAFYAGRIAEHFGAFAQWTY